MSGFMKKDKGGRNWTRTTEKAEEWIIPGDDGTVKIELDIPDLLPNKKRHKPKHGRVDVQVINGGMSLEAIAKMRDTKRRIKTTYWYSVKKLPSAVETMRGENEESYNRSDWHLEKGRIIITLKLKDNKECWTTIMRCTGKFDQSSDDEQQRNFSDSGDDS